MKKILIAFFSVLLSLGASAQSSYRRLDSLTATGSMIDALTVMNELNGPLKADSATARYWLHYSQASYVLFRYDDAKKAILKALRIDNNDPNLYYQQGLLYNHTGDLQLSVSAFSNAIAKKPEGDYYYWRGVAEQQLQQNDSAMQDYRTALDKSVVAAGLYNNYAILLITQEKFEEAMTMLNKALRLEPSAGTYSARSKLNLMMLNVDSACADEQRALQHGYSYRQVFDIPAEICKKNDAGRLQFVAEMLAYQKFYKHAVLLYDKLIAVQPDSANHYLNRGYCHYNLQEYDLAEADYLKCLSFPEGASEMLYNNMSLLYFDKGDYKKSAEYDTKRIALDATNYTAYLDRGLAYRKLKKYKESEDDFNRSLAIKPDFFRAFGYRGFLYLELGSYQKALDDARQSVKLRPDYDYGYLVLAQAKEKLGIPDFCADLYKAQQLGNKEAAAAAKQYCK